MKNNLHSISPETVKSQENERERERGEKQGAKIDE